MAPGKAPTNTANDVFAFNGVYADIALLPPRDLSQALSSNLPHKLHGFDKPPGTPDNREKPLTRKPSWTDGGSDEKWDGLRGKTYRSFELTLKNQAQVAGLGYLLNPNFMLYMLYAKAYAFSQECYNKTAYSGYQILLDDKSLRGLIHQGIKSDLHSMSELRHESGIMVFLDIQATYGRDHFADDTQYASHINI